MFVLDGSKLPAFGSTVRSVATDCAKQQWGGQRHGRMGSAMELLPPAAASTSSSGSSSSTAQRLLVSSPMASTNATEMGGGVQLLSF